MRYKCLLTEFETADVYEHDKYVYSQGSKIAVLMDKSLLDDLELLDCIEIVKGETPEIKIRFAQHLTIDNDSKIDLYSDIKGVSLTFNIVCDSIPSLVITFEDYYSKRSTSILNLCSLLEYNNKEVTEYALTIDVKKFMGLPSDVKLSWILLQDKNVVESLTNGDVFSKGDVFISKETNGQRLQLFDAKKGISLEKTVHKYQFRDVFMNEEYYQED